MSSGNDQASRLRQLMNQTPVRPVPAPTARTVLRSTTQADRLIGLVRRAGVMLQTEAKP